MSVKLILLKSGENIISDIKEGFLDDKLVCYILENPCLVFTNEKYKIFDSEGEGESADKLRISLQTWPILSQDTIVELINDWVITIVSPSDELKQLYETKILLNGELKNDQDTSIDEQSDSDQSD